MRILVHDFAGHPFQIQLSRELARRGNDVLHLYCASVEGGKGAVEPQARDPRTFSVSGVALSEAFAKYSGRKRFSQEREYGKLVGRSVAEFKPDVVLSANTPLFAQQQIMKAVRAAGGRFVFWQQDVVGVAMQRILRQKLPVVGGALGSMFPRFERRLVRRSDRVVAITEDFVPLLSEWGIDASRISAIPNWAPLEELSVEDRDNEWSRSQGLSGKTVILYAGTLGLKHDPSLLFDVARSCAARPDVVVVVVSEGPGADWLRSRLAEEPLANLILLPYQPYEVLSQVLASGDVLTVLLEPDAGVFSVPSKVLSYFCASRAILGAIPSANLAYRLLEQTGAGFVCAPEDRVRFQELARRLIDDRELRAKMAFKAREYAVQTFDIVRIADHFETIFRDSMGMPSARGEALVQ